VSKEVSPDAEQESSLLSLQNEVRLLQNIRHEHIVAFVAALSLPGGHFCYLQEFARGGTLDAAIRARRTLATPFASTVVARWMRQLATAMVHLHGLRVLHRDLSTKNILLSAPPCEGDIRVCDFGVAKALSLSHSNLASTIAGTPYYWSPEVLKGVPYGLAADIWSVGVVAFELLTLKRPFVAESLPALQLLVAQGTANGTFSALDEALRACAHPYPLAWLATTEALLHTDPARRLPLASVIEVASAEEVEAVGAATAAPSDAAIDAAKSPPTSDVCHATSDASTGSTTAAVAVAAVAPGSPTLTPPQPALVQRRKKAVL
jgi:NIMA (never in mitosis gene a)-related kinase